MANHPDDPATYSALGRFFHRLAQPEGTKRLIWVLIALATVAVLLQFTYETHGYMNAEHYFGFYAAYGFVMFTGLILLAKLLRRLVGRSEDYYAPHAVDTEDYPEGGLERRDHNV